MASHLQWNGKIKEQDRKNFKEKEDEKEEKNEEKEEKTKNN